jgi:GNAT superfamily N-acetyltransferase
MAGSGVLDLGGGVRVYRADAAVATGGLMIEIRTASERDFDPTAEVLSAAVDAFRGSVADWILDAYVADLIDVRGRATGAELYVAISHGRLVGTVSFYPDVALEGFNLPAGWSGFRALGVHPDARGHGIGRQLVELCIERARACGASTIGIHTGEFMTAAIAIYERLGFRRLPEYDMPIAQMFPADERADGSVAIAFRLDL